MKYDKVVSGTFVSRPNKFIADVIIGGNVEAVHVKNTGRCKELLVPGTTVYMSVSDNPSRKTKYDLIAVEKKRNVEFPLLVNMDSVVVNDVAAEWLLKSGLFSHDAVIRREVTHGSSRFDFYIKDDDREAFLEVKGVTLEYDGIAMFPDAPTERGIKHINELISCISEGYRVYILFVIQMKGTRLFKPNDITHKAFGDALRKAHDAGVKILAMDCNVEQDLIEIDSPIPIEF